MRHGALTVGLMVAASGGAAQDGRDAFVSALRERGCTMTDAVAAEVAPALGLTSDDLFTLAQGLMASGEASVSADGRTLTLSPEACGDPLAALREEVLDLVRGEEGCRMESSAIAGVFTVMGYPEGDVRAVLDALAAGGQAKLSPDGVTLVLTPAACADPALSTPSPTEASAALELALGGRPGCRAPLADLLAGVEAGGVDPDAADRALSTLSAIGRLVPDGSDVMLRPDLCGVPRAPDWQLDRIVGLGTEAYRASIGLVAMETGCRLPMADRPALVAELAGGVAGRLSLGTGLSPDALAALGLRIAEVLDNPGPAYQIDGATGDLVLRYCTP